jgi:hypothetical protein
MTTQRTYYLLFLLLATASPLSASAEVLLFSNDNKNHGCLDCSQYDSESVCNRYGTYGNKYSSDSIWSQYGTGSRYNSSSPFNRYGNGLKMVDRSGMFYGVFSIGSSGQKDIRRILEDIWESSDGDYETMRDRFCDLNLKAFFTGASPPPSPLKTSVSVTLKPAQCRGYFLADGDSNGVYLLQWYGGFAPEVGDPILGDLASYGFKDVYYPQSRSKGQVYVDDYMLSRSRAIEKLAEKCR